MCVYKGMEDFEAWAQARSAALARSAYLLTGDLHHAEDLAQETLVRVALRWSRLARDSSPDAYARVVMYRLAVDSWRRRRSRPREFLGRPPDLAEADDAVEERLVLRDALARLTAKQRAVLALRFYEDLTEVQTAEVLGVSVSTVKSQTRDALARIRAVAGGLLAALTTEEPS
jgi:RNA polymerase sigma-70 factor (sigma-E family)